MSKKLILSQKQLDEICGGNSAYLDNEFDGFKHIGNNEITSDGFVDGDFGNVMLNKDWAMQDRGRGYTGLGTRGRERVSYLAYENTDNDKPVIYEDFKKKDWNKRYLSEEFKDPMLVNATFATGNSDENGNIKNRSIGSIKTEKLRYRAAQALAKSNDPEKKKRGEQTLKTMEKNDPNLKFEIEKYDNLRGVAKNIRKTDKEVLGKKIVDRSGTSNGDGKAHTPKDDEFSDGILSYDA